MRNMMIFAVLFMMISAVHADVSISDRSQGEVNLYQLFNGYFGLQGDAAYTSSQDLYNAIGVNPSTTWTTSGGGTQISSLYKHADATLSLSVFDTNSQIVHDFGTINTTAGNGIVNWTSPTFKDELELDFRLSTKYDNLSTTLSSNTGANSSENVVGREIVGKSDTPTFVDTGYGWAPDYNIYEDRMGDDMVHMIALDIKDLYNAKYGTDFESVYMFGWEDLLLGYGADWDYNDMVLIMTNITATNPDKDGDAATPEPATLAILGLGLAGLGLIRRRRK